MSSPIIRLGKESIIYGFSTLLARFLNFLLVPFYTTVFTTADFGVYSVFFSLIAFLSVVFALGLAPSYLRLGADMSGDERKSLFTSLILISVTVTGLLGFLVYYFRNEWLFLLDLQYSFTDYFFWLVIILLLDVWSMIPFSHLRLTNQPVLFSSLRLLNVMVHLLMNYWFLVVQQYGLTGVFYANAAASLLNAVCVFFLTRHQFLFRVSVPAGALKPVLLFVLPLIPSGLGTMFNEVADRVFIQHISPEIISAVYPGKNYSAEDLTGIYSAAYKLGIFMMLITHMFSLAWQPFYQTESKKPNADVTLGSIFIPFLVFMTFTAVVLGLFMHELVRFSFFGFHIIHPNYWFGLSIVPYIILAYLFSGILSFFYIGSILAKNSSNLLFVVSSGVLVTFAGNFVLLPVLGILGSAVTTMAAYLVMAVLQIRKSQQLFPLIINKEHVVRLIVLNIPMWIFIIFNQNNQLLNGFGKLIVLILFAISLFLVKIVTVQQILSVKRLFIRS